MLYNAYIYLMNEGAHHQSNHQHQKTGIRLIFSLLFSLLICGLAWIIFAFEKWEHISLVEFGIYPRSVEGLKGILFSAFIHGDIDHILGNTLPLLILSAFTFYFYPGVGWKSFLLIWLLGGFWTWLMGRPSYHIGASGLIYGLATFLFFSGWFSKNYRLLAISLLVVFLYGSMFWGLFPIQPQQSWEAHLSGALAGVLAAFYFKNKLPQREKYEWEINESEDENEEENEYEIDENNESENNSSNLKDNSPI
jgi:membrane associated rhomboid family serine protease